MKRAPLHTAQHIHTISCGNVYSHLCENLDGDIDSEACRRIKAHLQDCPNCSALLDSLKKTVYLYKKLPAPKVPAGSREKLLAVIKLDPPKKKRTR